MKRFTCLMMMLVLSVCTHAATPIFLIGPGDPDAPPPNDNPESFGTRVEFQVVPNMRGIGENAVRDRPEPLVANFPSRELPMEFSQRRFEPLEGFVIDRSGAVQLDPKTPNELIRFNWYGESENGDMTLVVDGGRSTARLTVDNTVYLMVTDRGLSTLRWLDISQFPPEMDYPSLQNEKSPLPGLEKLSGLEMPAAQKYIDHVTVLVVHTPSAVTLAGSATLVQDRATTAVFQLSTALVNSGINQTQITHIRPNGAASLLVNYDESPGIIQDIPRFFTHRKWLRTNSTVTQWRNQYEADIVIMLIADDVTGGLAYIQRPDCGFDLLPPPFGGQTDVGSTCNGVGSGFAPYAFAVVNVESSVSTITLAHEAGHVFGMDHNPEYSNPAEAGSFSWSYGHWAFYQTPETLRTGSTLMSDTSNCPGGCTRVAYFSNPNIAFPSMPNQKTGSLVTDAYGRYRFNARTLALLAPVTSEFRGPVVIGRIFRNDFEALPDGH